MEITGKYAVSACWERGLETPDELAERTLKLVRSLQNLTPNFGSWFQVNYEIEDLEPIDGNLGLIAKRIAWACGIQSDGSRNPHMGYLSYMVNRPDTDPRPDGWYLHFSAGGIGSKQHLKLSSDCEGVPDPRCIDYDVIKGAVLAISDAFEPHWCAAWPLDLFDLMDLDRYTRAPALLAWMINLSPELAPLVTPPATSIHAYGSDGSLFMTATTDTFVTQNPQHLAAAQAIFAVVDPLNFQAPLNTGRPCKMPR